MTGFKGNVLAEIPARVRHALLAGMTQVNGLGLC